MTKNMIVLSTAAGQQLYMLKASIEIKPGGEWTQLGVSGRWEGHPSGPFEMNQAVYDQMVTNYMNGQIDIVVDYEHQTLWGMEAPAAGWIRKMPNLSLKAENGELFGKIDWKQKGRAYIDAEEYKYVSPVFLPNTISQVDGSNIGWTLHSVALTNKPFLEELDEVRLNKLTQLHHHKEDETMTEAEKKEMEDLRTENQTLKTGEVALKQEVKDLKEKVQKHEEDTAVAKVDAAIAAKKLHPDQKESALKMCKADPKGFDAFLGGAKPMVQLPGDDMYENKGGQGVGKEIDVVAIALGNH